MGFHDNISDNTLVSMNWALNLCLLPEQIQQEISDSRGLVLIFLENLLPNSPMSFQFPLCFIFMQSSGNTEFYPSILANILPLPFWTGTPSGFILLNMFII